MIFFLGKHSQFAWNGGMGGMRVAYPDPLIGSIDFEPLCLPLLFSSLFNSKYHRDIKFQIETNLYIQNTDASLHEQRNKKLTNLNVSMWWKPMWLINNDQSFFYFKGEDPDADICHQNLKSVHQKNESKIVHISAGWSGDTAHAASCVDLAVLWRLFAEQCCLTS